jgi:endogenous inhibitor of DNA gyrase (YacG/DUF329 family)
MRCPICKKTTQWQENPFRPFCSERCKLIDLDNWLSGRYRIPGSVEADPGIPEGESAQPPGLEENLA